MAKRFTLVKVERDINQDAKILLPEFTQNEIYKVGVKTLIGMNKVGQFVYGKNKWNKARYEKF